MKVEFTKEAMGLRIKEQRKKLRITQEELAEAMCIPKLTISAYENGKVDIKSSVIVELAEHLQTTPNWLMGYEEDEEKNDTVDDTIVSLLAGIKDEKVKEMLLVQIQAVVGMQKLK